MKALYKKKKSWEVLISNFLNMRIAACDHIASCKMEGRDLVDPKRPKPLWWIFSRIMYRTSGQGENSHWIWQNRLFFKLSVPAMERGNFGDLTQRKFEKSDASKIAKTSVWALPEVFVLTWRKMLLYFFNLYKPYHTLPFPKCHFMEQSQNVWFF